jgi:hypothetical protein
MPIRLSVPCLAVALMLPAMGFAQDAGPSFKLELNKAEDTDAGSCRLTYVAHNDSETALDRTEYEVAIFDAEGEVSRLLVLKFGALVEGKTRVLQFELPGTTCDGISRIVINTSSACIDAATGQQTDFCSTALKPSSRTAIQFDT